MTAVSSHDLELKAGDERWRLHRSCSTAVAPSRQGRCAQKTREHLALVCALAALLGLTTGYRWAGIFVHR
jgi:hypothetical protein